MIFFITHTIVAADLATHRSVQCFSIPGIDLVILIVSWFRLCPKSYYVSATLAILQ